ncbi:MAG: UPF0175 family protein [Candidatus Hydrothermarchaeales archaeon]
MKVKTVRIRENRAREIEKIAEGENKATSEVIRDILERGLKDYKIEKAIQGYQMGTLSQGAAAEAAGLTIQELHHEIKRRGFVLRMDEEKIEAELEGL